MAGRHTRADSRVLYVINDLGAGGAERSLAEMLPTVQAAGFEPVVAVMFRRPDGVEASLAQKGFDIRLLDGSTRFARTAALHRLIAELAPDLVHTTNVDADIAGRIAAARSGARVLTSLVTTPYAPARLRDPSVRTSKVRLAQFVDAATARLLTTHFHAITHAVKEAAVRSLRIPAERITVIERGRDPVRLGRASPGRRAAARRLLGIPESQPVILSVGRQEFAKGQIHLVAAVARLAGPVEPLLLVAGRRGTVSSELDRAVASLGVGSRVRFLGHREDVPELLAAADVFAFPSLYEGQGGALIEAMALGLPIVASDLPAIQEVVAGRRAAVLVPPGEPGPLAAAIAGLLADPAAARELGDCAQQRFVERFTLDASLDRMVALYGALLDAEPGRPLERSR